MLAINRKIQIGVMGSSADLKYSPRLENLARQVGLEIAKSGNILVYGAEKDGGSLSTTAAYGAKEAGGLTVGITYGCGKNIFDKTGKTDIIIATGLERGGGREFVLVNSCDVIILIAGGSGTLSEAAIAYQINVPIIALARSGGWADKLSGTYLDARRRLKVVAALDPVQAVKLAIKEARLKF